MVKAWIARLATRAQRRVLSLEVCFALRAAWVPHPYSRGAKQVRLSATWGLCVLSAAAITTATLLTPIPAHADPVHAAVAAQPATAWRGGAFHVDTAGLISRSDVVLAGPAWQPSQSMPLGNGELGAAVWAQDYFTAQLNRGDTYPDMLSSGQVVIPGLKAMDLASDYQGRLNLYDGVFQESGGGMRADSYVDHSRDALIVEVSGADPGTLQTVQLHLWPGRTPTTYASGPTAALADTDTRGNTLSAITAAGSDVQAKVLNNETVQVQFYPRSDGSFRVVAAAPKYAGGDVPTAVNDAVSGLTSPPAAVLSASTLNTWHAFWRNASPMELHSSDGSADYLETVRAISLYTTAASSSPDLPMPATNGGVATLFRFSQDQTDWGPYWWHWNLRHQMQANWAAGMANLNASFFNAYRSHLQLWMTRTQQRMSTDGACVPELFDSGGTPPVDDCHLQAAGQNTALILSSGPEVAHEIWEQYQYTGDLAFLKQNFPVMDETARFLLDYAKLGPDGKLHTDPSDALESVQKTSNPVTDVAAMKVVFPLVAQVADMLGEDPALAARLRAAIPEIPGFTIASRDSGVIAPSETDATVGANGQNPQVEPVWPWGLFGDNGGAATILAVRTFENRPNTMTFGWDPSPVQAARLGLAGQVQNTLVEGTKQFQTCPSGMATFARADSGHLCGQGGFVDPYNEWGAEATLGMQEASIQDYNGLLQIAPALPSSWDADISLKTPGGHTVSTQVRGGVPTLVGIQAGSNDTLRIRNPWPGQQIEVVDGASEDNVLVASTSADEITLPVSAGNSYLLERTAVPYSTFAFAPVSGTAATTVRHLGDDAVIGVAYSAPPPPCVAPSGSGPLVDWIPQSGNTISDASSYQRNAAVSGGASYTTGPDGPTLTLTGSNFVQSQQVAELGPLSAATFAAEVRVDNSGTYRRLFDDIPIGGEAVGFLVDLDPANQVRFIGGGSYVQTTAVVPTGQFVKLVVTLGTDGQLTVYINGAQAWTGSTGVTSGLNGCANLKLQFGADQAGGSDLVGAVGEMRIWPEALTRSEVAGLLWQ